MTYAYIGIVIMAVILIGFVTLSIFWVVRSVGKSIRGKTLDIISQYDGLIEAQSLELTRLHNLETTHTQAPKADVTPVSTTTVQTNVAPMFIMNTAERISTTAYTDHTVGQLYTQIRNAFTATPQEIFAQLPNQGVGGSGGPASHLLEQLTFDTVFELSTLDPATQLSLLEEAVPQEAQSLLQAYQVSVKQFNSLDFYRHLQDLAQLEPRPTVIRVPRGQQVTNRPANSIIMEDDELCEGMEIEVGNVLYDFCIKAREIG